MSVQDIASDIIRCFKSGNKIFVIGNGGSATMSSHMVGELQGQFNYKRKPLPALSLFDLASMTAIANDLGYDKIFVRPLEALGKPGDILVTLSTSGKSKNILKAIKYAQKHNIKVIDWPRKGEKSFQIQENQLKEIHKVCGIVEKEFVC